MAEEVYEILKMGDVHDRIVKKGRNFIVVERDWPPDYEFYFVLRYNFRPTFWIIPAVVYNGNRQGFGTFPRPSLRTPWFFREDRCTIPSAGIVENDKYVVALFVDPAKSEEELSSVSVQNGKIVIRIPWIESPLRYARKGGFSKAMKKYFTEKKPYRRRFFIIYADYRNLGYERGYYFVLEKAWKILGGRRPVISEDRLSKYVRLKAQFAVNVHYFKLGYISSFLQFGIPNTPIAGGSISASFTGKALEAALSLYRIYLVNGDHRLREIAFSVADFHCRGLRNGIFYTDYHIARHRWYGFSPLFIHAASTRQIGEALYFLLRLYILAKQKEEEHSLWLLVARKMGDLIISRQRKNGDFGKWIDPKNGRIFYGGTNGAYIIWFLSLLFDITKNRKYLDACKKAMNCYIKRYVENDIYWGDTLDASCIDKEGGHAILRACLLLYERTKEKKYLIAAERAAYYLTTWMFMWDVPFNECTVLSKYNFRTRGWTVVSVENQHLDPYGIVIAPDMVRLYKHSSNEFWLEVGLTMAKASMSLISDKIGKLGASKIFIGFQPEQIYHTDWIYLAPLKLLARVFHDAKGKSPKGIFANSVFWVVSACLGGALDLAEELGIKLRDIQIEFYDGLSFKIFKILQYLTSLLNFAL